MHLKGNKGHNSKWMYFYGDERLGLIGIALVYFGDVNEREDLKPGMGTFQNNIYRFMKLNGILCIHKKSMEFYLCLWSSIFV